VILGTLASCTGLVAPNRSSAGSEFAGLSPWAGVGVMAGCTAALTTVAFVVLRERDA
jgi:hypothetical protein